MSQGESGHAMGPARGGEWPGAAALHARARRVMPGGNTRGTVYRDPYPPYAARGEGAYVIDVDGRRFLDALNNYTALIHGHADPLTIDAVFQQAARGSSFGLPTASEVELAELLTGRIAAVEQVRFMNSGTEAVMAAVQAARAFTGRPGLVKFAGSYHGSSDLAAVGTTQPRGADGTVAGAAPTAYAAGTPAVITGLVTVLPYNDLAALETTLAEPARRDDLAAVLVDLMPWRMGLIGADPAWVTRLRELTAAHGILLIVDEVITLRLGQGGWQAHYGVTPDLTTLGKVIGGGYPIGAVGGRAEVMAVFDPGRPGGALVPHGGTFTANLVTMAAGLATMRQLTPEALAALARRGELVRDGIRAALAAAGIAGQVTGAGSLFGVVPHDRPLRDYAAWLGTSADQHWRGAVYEALLAEHVLLTPHLAGCLSTAMTDADCARLVAAVGRAVRTIENAAG